MQPSGTYLLQNDDYIFLKWLMSFSFVCVASSWTASDYTMYPFSTQNGKDFQNLLSVYLDAVFFPCLREQDFRWVVTIAAQFWILLWFFVVTHIEVTLKQQQHVWFCVSSFPGRRAGGWRTKPPQIPTVLWCLKASCSTKWRVLL